MKILHNSHSVSVVSIDTLEQLEVLNKDSNSKSVQEREIIDNKQSRSESDVPDNFLLMAF